MRFYSTFSLSWFWLKIINYLHEDTLLICNSNLNAIRGGFYLSENTIFAFYPCHRNRFSIFYISLNEINTLWLNSKHFFIDILITMTNNVWRSWSWSKGAIFKGERMPVDFSVVIEKSHSTVKQMHFKVLAQTFRFLYF